MATKALTPIKITRNSIDPEVNRALLSTGTYCKASSAGPDFTVECDDLSNLFLLGINGTTEAITLTVSSTGTDFAGKGQGDYTFNTTAKTSNVIILGPFASNRFKDVSTGETLRFAIKSQAGSSNVSDFDVVAIQVMPNT